MHVLFAERGEHVADVQHRALLSSPATGTPMSYILQSTYHGHMRKFKAKMFLLCSVSADTGSGIAMKAMPAEMTGASNAYCAVMRVRIMRRLPCCSRGLRERGSTDIPRSHLRIAVLALYVGQLDYRKRSGRRTGT